MRLEVVKFVIVIAIATGCHGNEKMDSDAHFSSYIADLWLEGADVIRILWRDCSKKLIDVKDVIDHQEYYPKFMRCMKRKTLRALDRSLSTDVVPIADGVNLVRYELVDKTGNIMQNDNGTIWSEQELDEGEWRTLALRRMGRVLRTHVIKFDFDSNGNAAEKAEYRGRRRHQMMTMMMFGIVSIGMVMIPMGFQFLAVLGGKALLLAKMALILASIQGLKKIATNPINYGFYHYPPYDHYEKRGYADWPPPSIMPGTPPPSLSHRAWPEHDTSVKLNRRSASSKEAGTKQVATWRPDTLKQKEKSEPRLYPVYLGPTEASALSTAIDAPLPVAELTSSTGEVQADYTLELPFNGFRFQSPSAVISA